MSLCVGSPGAYEEMESMGNYAASGDASAIYALNRTLSNCPTFPTPMLEVRLFKNSSNSSRTTEIFREQQKLSENNRNWSRTVPIVREQHQLFEKSSNCSRTAATVREQQQLGKEQQQLQENSNC